MKNIFKLMGIALIASSMLVACNKENNEEENNGNNDTPVATSSVKVTFGSANWEPAVAQVYVGNYDEYGVNEYILFKEQGNYPFVDLMISAMPGTYQHEATLGQNVEQGYSYYSWGGNNYYDLYNVQYFESQNLGTSQEPKSDWQPVSASLTVTSFDINTMVATFTLNATMYDYYSWYTDVVTNAEDADTKDFEVKANNYTFTEVSK